MLSLGKYSVSQDPLNPDRVILEKDGVRMGPQNISIAATRAYLCGFNTAKYTLNAAIRIARFTASSLKINYHIPTDLNGTETDMLKILPDEIALGIVLMQAHHGVEADGIPGADFIRNVMKLHRNISVPAHCRAAFMDESVNKTAKTEAGKKITMPDFKADQKVVYDFLRNITLARNGMWSDKPLVVNLTGLRMEHGNHQIRWDDSIAACWTGVDGSKNAKIYTATTEPGDRTVFKTMLPQTMVFVPGYHQGKLPAMRGHRTVAFDPVAKFPDRLIFNTNDERGLNLHPGGTTGAMKKLKKYVFPVGASTEAEFRAVLVFMEIFEILSRWGLDPAIPAWEKLRSWAEVKALNPAKAFAGKISVFQDETALPVKQVGIATARGWLVKKWKNNRTNLARILKAADPGFKPPAGFFTMETKGLESLVLDRHIEAIVAIQCRFFTDPKEVDGMAGDKFLSLLNAEIPADGSLAQLANTDFGRISELAAAFDKGDPVLTPERLDYVKQICTQTLLERSKIHDAQQPADPTDPAVEIDEPVSNWSILCQVVFGPEKFYEMMRFTLAHAIETGQRFWYYTLIDAATIPK